MNPKFARPLFATRRAWSPIRRVGLAAALMLGSSAVRAATPVADAASVAPAPLVDQPLAPAVADVPGAQPSPQHTWVPGHWRWRDGAYLWEAGRWEIPPAPHLTWISPQWLQQGNGYVLKAGYWSEAAPPANPPASAPVAATPPPAFLPPAPNPVAVAPQPPLPAQPPGPEVFTTEAPPAPHSEVMPARPSSDHVWVAGYWTLNSGRYQWNAGRWEVPPRANMVWVSPRWEPRGNRYVFVNGYWSDPSVAMPAAPPPAVVYSAPPQSQQQVVIVSGPPPPRPEMIYPPPGPGFVWVNGFWLWRAGRYHWVEGHYERPPRGMRYWNEPRWERRGGNYFMIQGHWGR